MRSTSCGFDDAAGATGADLLVQAGPTLIVDIGFDPTHSRAAGDKAPLLALRNVHALVDTGAQESCIDSQLALTLGLPIVDQAVVAGIGGRKSVNMHLAQIHVPSLGHTIYGPLAGVDLAAGGQQHQVLIGRSFLSGFAMHYNGATGEVAIYDPTDEEPGDGELGPAVGLSS